MPVDAIAAPHDAIVADVQGILPVGITSKTVTTGPWTLPDGTVANGRATITCPVNLVHLPTGQPLASGQMTQRLVNGAASWNLCPTDQTGLNRVDWTYELRVELQGALEQPAPIFFLLPQSGPTSLDLDGLAPVPSSAGNPVAPITVVSVNGDVGAVVLTAADVGADPAGAATAAQAAAIAAAATDATSKAATAQTAATTAAATDAATKAAAAQAYAIQRANHTGTQPATTITGLDAAVVALLNDPASATYAKVMALIASRAGFGGGTP